MRQNRQVFCLILRISAPGSLGRSRVQADLDLRRACWSSVWRYRVNQIVGPSFLPKSLDSNIPLRDFRIAEYKNLRDLWRVRLLHSA